MKHMEEDEGEEKKKLKAIKLELREKDEEIEALESLNKTLTIMYRTTNDEMQDARKELIEYMSNKSARALIRVKKMGELDSNLFVNLVKSKFDDDDLEVDEVETKAVKLCTQWEVYLRDANWHPFKVVTDEAGNAKEILDENDEKLSTLKDEFGKEVFEVVTRALLELHEYNPSGRYPIPEIWNFKEGRKASMTECVSDVMKQVKVSKRKRTQRFD